jgi:HEAT repeat protein
MGFFDFLSKKKSDEAPKKGEREIARLGKVVGSKLSQNYDRQEAIDELSRLGTAESAMALLRRFDFSMDPSITDQEEKSSAARGIAKAGEAALEPIRSYCKKAESLTWPLKVLRQIVPEDEIVDELLDLLDQFDIEYVRNPEPKVQLINALEEYPSEDVRIAVEPFMSDASEPVRFAAVTTVFAMKNEASVPALLAALEEEESLRIKNRIAQGLVDKSWSVSEDLRARFQAALPELFTLRAGVVRRVG